MAQTKYIFGKDELREFKKQLIPDKLTGVSIVASVMVPLKVKISEGVHYILLGDFTYVYEGEIEEIVLTQSPEGQSVMIKTIDPHRSFHHKDGVK